MSDVVRASLENALREFEPLFWVGPWGETLDRLYEPDGTLYAICLDGPTELTTDRRKVRVEKGDLVVVPPAVALDATPAARWLGLVYTGPYPYHFRERFIQVWGFEHIPLGLDAGDPHQPDLRHRIYISRGTSCEPGNEISATPEFQMNYYLPDEAGVITENDLVWKMAGQTQAHENDGRDCICFRIPLESVYLHHREARPQPNPARTMSPEFRPESK